MSLYLTIQWEFSKRCEVKKYISTLLIPCLLLQLCGCYSHKEITLEELKSYKGTNDIKIITEEKDIIINGDSTETFKSDLIFSDSSVIVQEKTLIGTKSKNRIVDENNEIKFHQIKSITIEESDIKTTVILVISIVVYIGLGILAMVGGIQSGL